LTTHQKEHNAQRVKRERVSPRLQGALLSCGLQPAARRLFAECDPRQGQQADRGEKLRAAPPRRSGAHPRAGSSAHRRGGQPAACGRGSGSRRQPELRKRRILRWQPVRTLVKTDSSQFSAAVTQPDPDPLRRVACQPKRANCVKLDRLLRRQPVRTLVKADSSGGALQQPAFAERGSLL